jgi:glycosyltransferase involved in cell wall biosynthesis
VTCQDRRRYLRQAVESVLAQDVNRNRFEIIVVKNYRDESIDAFLSRINVRAIFCEAKSVTQKAAEGFRVSRGDVLLFLDDDDLFEPTRLKVVLMAFDEHPDLGFYRNEVTCIGSDGARFSRDRARSFGIHPPEGFPQLYLEGKKKYAFALRLVKASTEFNSSSMAIRRELFEQGMPYLPRMTTSLDTLLWFEGLASDGSILLDNQTLTRYRIHDSNYSLARGQSRDERVANMLEVSRSHDRDYRVVKEYVTSTGRKPAVRQIEASILANRMTMLLRNPSSHREDFLRLYLEVVKYWDTVPIWRAVGEFLSSALYLLAPGSARRLHDRSIGI